MTSKSLDSSMKLYTHDFYELKQQKNISKEERSLKSKLKHELANDHNLLNLKLFLKSGPDNRFDFYKKMTDSVFFQCFFVDSEEQKEKRNKIINLIYRGAQRNLIVLKGVGGSGKTVFIKKLILDLKEQKEKTHISIFDFGLRDDLNKVLEKTYIDFLKKSQRRDITYALINEIDQLAFSPLNHKIKICLEHLILKAIENAKFDANNKKHITDRLARLTEIIPSSRELQKIKISLILLLQYKLNVNRNIKEVLIFDNIENLDDSKAFLEDVKYAYELLKELLSKFDFYRYNFHKNFCFIFSSRRTTDIYLQNVFIHLDGNRPELIEFKDMLSDAINKKIEYCMEFVDEKSNKILNILLKIITSPKNTDGAKFLKHFTSERFLPFFGSSYRLAVESLLDFICIKDSNSINPSIEDLIAYGEKNPRIYKICMNGVRLIIFKHIFDEYFQSKIFESFGIYQTNDSDDISFFCKTALDLLYWNKKFNGRNIRYYGLQYREFRNILLDIANNTNVTFLSDNIPQLVLEKLSTIFDYNNRINKEKMGHLIDFYDNNGYYLNLKNIDDINKNDHNLRIKINPTGELFVEYIYPQFEFLNSQYGIENSLFEKSFYNLDELDDIITTFYKTLKEHINDSLERGMQLCKIYNRESNKQRCRLDCEKTSCHCSLFARCKSIIRSINEAIYYLDRYRIYLISKQTILENALRVNFLLLNHIIKIAELLKIFIDKRINRIQKHDSKSIRNTKVKLKKMIQDEIEILNEGDNISCNYSSIITYLKNAQQLVKDLNECDKSTLTIENLYFNSEKKEIINLFNYKKYGKVIMKISS